MTQTNDKPPIRDSEQPFRQMQEAVESLTQFNRRQLQVIAVLRWLGYGFLLLFLFDLIESLYPPQFMNPAWEFETFGQLVERVPVPLLGFALAIMGGRTGRSRGERSLLKFLSWLTLVSALVFFLSVPLAILDTVRIAQQLQTEITTQLDQQTAEAKVQVQAVKERLEQVQTPAELKSLLSQLDRQEQAPEIDSDQQLDTVKRQIASSLDNQVTAMKYRARRELANRRQALLRRSVKWNLGALVSGALFFILWKGTAWARRKRSTN